MNRSTKLTVPVYQDFSATNQAATTGNFLHIFLSN